MYKLYYSSGSCSMSVHVALNECNQPVTLEKLNMAAGQNKTPEYLKINPRGQVPVLIDGDQTLREGAAILLHVLDKHKSPLMPSSGPARDAAIEWMMFANATLHPAYGRCFFLKRNNVEGAALDAAYENLCKLWEEVEQRLATQPYICGDQVTIADIMMTVMANWISNLPKPVSFGSHTKRLFRTIIERPAYQKALAEEQVEYKAAA